MARVQLEFDCDHWIAGARRFPAQFGTAAAAQWERALDDTYQASQRIVHVVTGSLKQSGRKEVTVVGEEIIASLVYGGPSFPFFVDYADIEYYRGGDHDYLTPAFVATADRYGPALIGAYEEVMATWR